MSEGRFDWRAHCPPQGLTRHGSPSMGSIKKPDGRVGHSSSDSVLMAAYFVCHAWQRRAVQEARRVSARRQVMPAEMMRQIKWSVLYLSCVPDGETDRGQTNAVAIAWSSLHRAETVPHLRRRGDRAK